MNNLCCNSKPLLNIFQDNSSFWLLLQSWECQHSSELSRWWSDCAWQFADAKLFLCIIEIFLTVSHCTAHSICPLSRLVISTIAFCRLSLLVLKASAEHYFLLWMQKPWCIDADTYCMQSLSWFAFPLIFLPCIIVPEGCCYLRG